MNAPAATLSATKRRTIVLLSFCTFASMMAQRICDAMLPELSRVFSVSLADASKVVSVFAITYGASQLFYGPLGDKLGKFRVITYATLGCSAGSVLAIFAGSLDVLVFARLLTALGAAAMIPLSMAWVGDSVPPSELQEMLTRTGLGSTIGIVSGQMMGGFFTDAFGWRWAFVFLAVLFAVVGLLMHTDLRRQDREQPVVPAKSAADAATTPQRFGFARQTLLILSGRCARVILGVSLLEGAAGFGMLAIWPSHLHSSLGLSLTISGSIVALFGLGGVLYMAMGRFVIRRLGQPALVLVGGILVGLCAAVLAYSRHWLPTLPASLMAGFGFFMFHNVMQTSATQMAPLARGTAVSLFASFLFLGQSIGVVLAASLIAIVGTSAVVALGGSLVAVLGVYFAWMLQRRERQALEA